MKSSMERVSQYMQESSNIYAKAWDMYMSGLNVMYENQEQMNNLVLSTMDRMQTINSESTKMAENMIKQAKEGQMQLKNSMADTMQTVFDGVPAPAVDYFKELNAKLADIMQMNK